MRKSSNFKETKEEFLSLGFESNSIQFKIFEKYKEAMLIVDNLECFYDFID